MKTFKTEKYRNHTIEYTVNEEGLFQAYTDGLGATFFQGHSSGYHKDLDTVEKQIRTTIDNFRTNAPTTMGELAERIQNQATIWDTYEECHIDVKLLEVLVNNYITANE